MIDRSKVLKLESACQQARAQVRAERKALKLAKRKMANSVEAQKLVQSVAQTVQQTAHHRIASIVTRCLQTVYGESAYEFKIKFEQKRGRTEASLLFVRNGKEFFPLKETSGGQASVAAFALRLASLILANPPRRKLLVMDEPFVGVHKDQLPALRQLLLDLSKEMKVQIILVTHNSQFQVGKVVQL